jgi:hypothetical protein
VKSKKPGEIGSENARDFLTYPVVFHPVVSLLIDTGLQKMEFWRRWLRQ